MPELAVSGPSTHPAKRMVAEQLDVTLNTDNRLVSNTTMVGELALAVDVLRLSPSAFRRIIKCGFERSFFPGTPAAKVCMPAAVFRSEVCGCRPSSSHRICSFMTELQSNMVCNDHRVGDYRRRQQ